MCCLVFLWQALSYTDNAEFVCCLVFLWQALGYTDNAEFVCVLSGVPVAGPELH